MIRIKDYIFNENEIEYIKSGTTFKENGTALLVKTNGLNVKTKKKDLLFEDATFGDIEWNYGGVFEIMSEEEQLRQNSENDKDKILELRNDLIDKLQNQIKELEEKNNTFEDYNKDLNRQIDKLEEDLDAEKSINSYLSRRILKAIEYINNTDLGTLDKWELQEILKGEE
jgi:peptidoglycan hydrolase CwlO-like protein